MDMEGQCNAYYLMQPPLNNDGMELRDMESGAVDGVVKAAFNRGTSSWKHSTIQYWLFFIVYSSDLKYEPGIVSIPTPVNARRFL